MATFKIVWDIELEAESPLEAAKEAQDWLKSSGSNWQYYVQEVGEKEVFSVYLSEDDEDAVLPAENYQPLIK